MPHWHDHNPWNDRVVYVSLKELAAVTARRDAPATGQASDRDIIFVLAHWRAYGEKLDAYVLPQPDGFHSIGVRYGAGVAEYLSPAVVDEEALQSLLDRCAGTIESATPSP